MRGFEKLGYVLQVLSAVLLLQGCDVVRGGLGMPTSSDIALMKEQLQQEEENVVAQDSAAVADSAEVTQAQVLEDQLQSGQQTVQQAEPESRQEQVRRPEAVPVKGYHVVVGAFKEHGNAESLAEFERKQGYSPLLIPLKNGYMMVSLGQLETLAQAVELMESIRSREECPYDVWVYNARMKLHIEN